MIEECKHLNTFDPNSTSDPELRALWCCDCGALLLPEGSIRLPKTHLHIFHCPMCGQAPTKERNIFAARFEYQCSCCGFVPRDKMKFQHLGVSLEEWNSGVWKIITGDVEELRERYRDGLNKLLRMKK